MLKFLTIFILSFSACADPINLYSPTGDLVNLTRSDQSFNNLSALMAYDNTAISFTNNGGNLLWRTDMTDPDTTIKQLRYMNGCQDIEGAYKYGNGFLLAEETNPAQVYVMPPPSETNVRKCSYAEETWVLNGFDDTVGFGLEGITVLQNGTVVVIKEAQPARIASFVPVAGVTNYTPQDLFQLRADCSRLGDVTVKSDGNLLVICKTEKTVHEYQTDGTFIGMLAIPQFGQPEGIAQLGTEICIAGEPDEYQCFSATPPVYEECSAIGTVTADIVNNIVNGSVHVTCASVTGTLEVSGNL